MADDANNRHQRRVTSGEALLVRLRAVWHKLRASPETPARDKALKINLQTAANIQTAVNAAKKADDPRARR